MNLTDPEHIAAVRQALADPVETECWLVVEGDEMTQFHQRPDGRDCGYAPFSLPESTTCVCTKCGFNALRQYRLPADWVALTGACERCEEGAGCDIDMCQDCGDEYSNPCERHADHVHWTDDDGYRPDCIDGRKRATLTFDIVSLIPLAVATVEVLPVDDQPRLGDAGRSPYVWAHRSEACTWVVRDGEMTEFALHRQPVPNRDYVIHLTHLEPA